MTSQGERLFTISLGATLTAFTVFLVVGCQTKGNEIPQEIRVIAACNEQPSVTVRTYTGPEEDPGRYSEPNLGPSTGTNTSWTPSASAELTS